MFRKQVLLFFSVIIISGCASVGAVSQEKMQSSVIDLDVVSSEFSMFLKSSKVGDRARLNIDGLSKEVVVTESYLSATGRYCRVLAKSIGENNNYLYCEKKRNQWVPVKILGE